MARKGFATAVGQDSALFELTGRLPLCQVQPSRKVEEQNCSSLVTCVLVYACVHLMLGVR